MAGAQHPAPDPDCIWDRTVGPHELEAVAALCESRWAGRNLEIDWSCPRCGFPANEHFMGDVRTAALDQRKTHPIGVTEEPEPKWEPVDLECRCGHDHPGRPAHVEQGCGFRFGLDVPRDER